MKIHKPSRRYQRALLLARLVASLPVKLLYGHSLYSLKISLMRGTFTASYSIQQKHDCPEQFLVCCQADNVFDCVAALCEWVSAHPGAKIRTI